MIFKNVRKVLQKVKWKTEYEGEKKKERKREREKEKKKKKPRCLKYLKNFLKWSISHSESNWNLWSFPVEITVLSSSSVMGKCSRTSSQCLIYNGKCDTQAYGPNSPKYSGYTSGGTVIVSHKMLILSLSFFFYRFWEKKCKRIFKWRRESL